MGNCEPARFAQLFLTFMIQYVDYQVFISMKDNDGAYDVSQIAKLFGFAPLHHQIYDFVLNFSNIAPNRRFGGVKSETVGLAFTP